jgi:hypothetical protein
VEVTEELMFFEYLLMRAQQLYIFALRRAR